MWKLKISLFKLQFSKFLGKLCNMGPIGRRISVFVLSLSEEIYRRFEEFIAYLAPYQYTSQVIITQVVSVLGVVLCVFTRVTEDGDGPEPLSPSVSLSYSSLELHTFYLSY